MIDDRSNLVSPYVSAGTDRRRERIVAQIGIASETVMVHISLLGGRFGGLHTCVLEKWYSAFEGEFALSSLSLSQKCLSDEYME